ncbi:glycoside hydrolase, family 76 [Diplogelasinospora grovesii]|uniref:Glycoside hydrolase, family 76 n=1 Tax=Diplogelasinospora grovesii TaxID=303347 RepID=A0AAN6NBE6_9PEZI|nr:glycoside hydrolase, family 76 [Diplogelasinospora grovesii]
MLIENWKILLALAATAVVGGTDTSSSTLSFLPSNLQARKPKAATAPVKDQLLIDTLEALRVMQDKYFQVNAGTWPSAIDWTAAVVGTHVAGALGSLSKGLLESPVTTTCEREDFLLRENLVTLYFSQLVAFYFGQDAFSLRNQAYDDMLWVVLGWLGSAQFIESHGKSLFDSDSAAGADTVRQDIDLALGNQSWHGSIWTPPFAHRARIFWELASKGWDTTLCGGGMIWNPRLAPYKNAITNELYIAASINMYLNFPGDSSSSPFMYDPPGAWSPSAETDEWPPRDPKYLKAALDGYKWLMNSNMTNSFGLFADGFHISKGLARDNSHATDIAAGKCDQRDEMVYTYNQGVLLSGQVGLFKATGELHYLHAGHQLIQNVIRATGYDLYRDAPIDDLARLNPWELPPWSGLGRGGVLEEACDVSGECSQDAQTFKGIWMHHFTEFCAPLGGATSTPDVETVKAAHAAACQQYLGWLRHNAMAALGTRDDEGKFGMWWTAGLLNGLTTASLMQMAGPHNDTLLPPQSRPHAKGGARDVVDYRNYGVPNDPMWIVQGANVPAADSEGEDEDEDEETFNNRATGQLPIDHQGGASRLRSRGENSANLADPNNRGRGRTVETQGGGLAVLRALWELSKQADGL